MKRLRRRRGLSQDDVAALLGVAQQAVARWERLEVPRGRVSVVRAMLLSDLPPEVAVLRHERERSGTDQALLAARIGTSQATLSRWELGTQPVPRRDWPRLRAALDAVGVSDSAASAPQTPLTPPEIRRELQRLNWNLGDLANHLEVPRGTIGPWLSGHSPIPPRRWAAIRATLATAVRRPESDPVDQALRLVVAAVASEPGVLRTELTARVSAPEPHVRAAIRRALDAGELRERRVPRARSDGVVRFIPGLFPHAAEPAQPGVDRAALLVPRAVATIRASEGCTRRQIAERLPHDRRLAERAIDQAIAAGLAHERGVIAPRARDGYRLGVFAGAAPESLPRPLPGHDLRKLRKKFGASQRQLAKLVGASFNRFRRWEASEAPAAWAPMILEALRGALAIQRNDEQTLRVRIRHLVAAEPGIPRWVELSARLPGRRRGAPLRRVVDDLIAGGEIHERPVPTRPPGLFPGSPPEEWRPGREISGEDLRAMRAHAGLSQKQLAQRIGAGIATVNQWERGTRPIPAYRRPQLRRALADVRPPPPESISATDLRAARRRAGLSQAALATRVGASQPALSAWELGRRPVAVEHRERLRLVLADAPAAPGVSGADLTRWANRHKMGAGAIGALLGISRSDVVRWQRRGVPPARAAAVRALIRDTT